MDNLEVIKRIAEINGHWWVTCRYSRIWILKECVESKDHPLPTRYNPFDDDLCFQLMIKYKVTVQWLWDEKDGTPHYMAYVNDDEYVSYSKSPNRAILLTIIAAKEDKA